MRKIDKTQGWIWNDTQTGRQKDGQTERKMDRQTDGQMEVKPVLGNCFSLLNKKSRTP